MITTGKIYLIFVHNFTIEVAKTARKKRRKKTRKKTISLMNAQTPKVWLIHQLGLLGLIQFTDLVKSWLV